jgi:TolB protein
MTSYDIEQRLRAWYRDDVDSEPMPQTLYQELPVITRAYRSRTVSQGWLRAALAVAVLAALLAGLVATLALLNPPPPTPLVVNGVIAYVQDAGSGTALQVISPDGDIVRVLPRVAPRGAISWSPDGTRAAYVGESGVHVMNSDGTRDRLIADDPGATYIDVAWSPDGRFLAASRAEGSESDVVVMDVNGRNLRELTHGAGLKFHLAWSPDGTRIAFAHETMTRDGRFENSLHVIDLDGTRERQLTGTHAIVTYPAWSPDGAQIAFSRRLRPANGEATPYDPPWDIWIMSADGTDGRPLVAEPDWNELSPAWSPDGTQIVFVGQATDGFGIYVVNADGTGSRRIAGPANSVQKPAWAVLDQGDQ